MKFTRKIIVVALGSVTIFGTAQAQIPVTDGVHIATTVFNEVETILQWANQYEQMVQQIQQFEQQINQAKSHYNAIVGSRNMGQLITNSKLLPADWQSMITNIKSSAAFNTFRSKYPTYANKHRYCGWHWLWQDNLF